MTCIKTGANIYVASHGETFRGDVFRFQGVYVFRLTEASRLFGSQSPDWVVLETTHWFDRLSTFSTLISQSAQEVK